MADIERVANGFTTWVAGQYSGPDGNYNVAKIAAVLAITVGSMIAAGPAQAESDWTPRRLLEAVKYIADNVDLEDEETLTRLLRIELQDKERPLPEKSKKLKSQQVNYLTAVSYQVSLPLESEGGRKRAYIGLTLKHEQFCLRLEDAHAVLGDQYEIPPPALRDFWTRDGRVDGEAIARELRERDGKFDSIAYLRPGLPQGYTVSFHFRRCARELWISRRLPAAK